MSSLNARVTVFGTERLIGQLQKLSEKTQNVVVKGIVTEVSNVILKLAKAKCPRRKKGSMATGALYQSLGKSVKKRRDKKGYIGRVKPRKGFMRLLKSGEIHDPRRIAHIIEYGRIITTIKDKQVLSDGTIFYGKIVAAVPPHPFMRPALDEGKALTPAIAEKLVKRGITPRNL